MKITKLLAGTLMLVSLISCKMSRNVQKNSSQVDSTATSSKDVTKGTQIYQQQEKKKLDNSFANGQNKYQRQTVNYQFIPDTTGKNKGNITGLLPSELERRLTGITVTTEQGTQDVQTGKATQEQTGWTNAIKDTFASGEKKSAALNKVEAAKHIAATRKVGSFSWWLIILILLILFIIWKRKSIIGLLRWMWDVIKYGMPNTP